ncbi:MAG: putative quinol monooxygenase [Minwuia sp.]|uniref:putative quinol monooxygenase n=1 Tax=Minwuia sp. TaxID=2493630 RepID=UPI003A845F4F
MAVVVILEFKATDEAFEALKTGFSEILPDTEKYAGCMALQAATDEKNKSIVLYEVWDEIASQQKYMGWRTETGLMDKMGPMLREPPAIRTLAPLPY